MEGKKNESTNCVCSHTCALTSSNSLAVCLESIKTGICPTRSFCIWIGQ